MARKGSLGAKLAGTGVAARGSALKNPRRRNPGDTLLANGKIARDSSEGFVQTKGTRKNQTYFVKRGPSGSAQRVYDDGSTADATGGAKGTAGARSPRPAVLRQQQQSDIADTAQAAELYRKFLNKQRPSKVKMGLGGRMKMKTQVKAGRSGGVQAP